MGGEICIGISGWRYAPWRGVFYPEDLPQREELHYASRQVRTIEINGSFYSIQRPEYYARWRDETPDNFVFSVKGGRYITHLLRLKEVEVPLANFFASGVLALNQKLGPFLWQLPPMLPFKPERLAAFFKLLPRDTAAAVRLAEHHSLKRNQVHLESDRRRPIPHALEVRHALFATPEFVSLLRKHDIGLVVADTAGKWPFMENVTSNFVYVRLHGDEELYVSGYTPEALDGWAKKLAAWSEGREARGVFVYFDNDVKVRAPYDAMSLAHRLGLGPKPAPPPEIKADVRRRSLQLASVGPVTDAARCAPCARARLPRDEKPREQNNAAGTFPLLAISRVMHSTVHSHVRHFGSSQSRPRAPPRGGT